MQAPLPTRLRTLLALPLLVVAVVGGGSTGLAGLQLTAAPQPVVTDVRPPQQQVLGERADPTAEPAANLQLGSPGARDDDVPDARADWPAVAVPSPEPEPDGATADAVTKDARSGSTKGGSSSTSGSGSMASKPREFSGTNHFWMPVLGINKRVHAYPCSRTRPPDNYLYRWGCAGSNNVYLLGHAYSVMKPLHDAYVSGRLRVGMAAWYANGGGKVRKYRITEWRVVRPENAAWAIASQPVPSMTLQTCVGKNDAYRLVVRLVAVG